MPGPLHGVRVVDLTSMVSGPLCTMTLADQGADVIKIEAPSGDYARHVATRRGGFSASFLNNNRNKRSVVLDLKHPDGLAALRGLGRDADVLVQNFRPGVAERIGAGYDALAADNPGLIYVSIAGFGFDGPYAQKPVFDPLIQALSGLTTLQAGSDDQRPRLVRTILPDKLTGIQAAQAVAAALYARERHPERRGQQIHLSMLDTLVAFLWSSDMGAHTFVGDELQTETAQSFIDLIYRTRDGYVSIAVMQDKHWRGFCDAVEQPALLADPRFATPALREVNKDQRTRLIQQAVQHYDSAALLARLEDRDVPCAPVLTRRDAIRHPQLAANDLLLTTEHPQAGRLRQTRPPARFSRTATEHRAGAPCLGQHTAEVLRETGYAAAAVAALLASGAAQTMEHGAKSDAKSDTRSDTRSGTENADD